MDPTPFPRTQHTHQFLSSLRHQTGLEEPPRLIYRGRTENGREFVVGRKIIKDCLQPERLPGGGGATVDLDIRDIQVQIRRLQLRDAGHRGYVFSGDLIRSIIGNNQNQEIQLWGYPKKRGETPGVLVLTVGVNP